MGGFSIHALRNLDLSSGENLNESLSSGCRLASGDSSLNSLNTRLGNSDLFLDNSGNLSGNSSSLSSNLNESANDLYSLGSLGNLDLFPQLLDLLGARLVSLFEDG